MLNAKQKNCKTGYNVSQMKFLNIPWGFFSFPLLYTHFQLLNNTIILIYKNKKGVSFYLRL